MLYIFDLDGTLRVTLSGRPCPNELDDQEILPGVKEKLLALSEEGHKLAAASNQGGVSLGYMSVGMARAISMKTKEMLENVLCSIMLCPYHPNGDLEKFPVDCRKPKPFMIEEIMVPLLARKDETMFVGDAFTDQQAAENAGVKFAFAHEFFGWGEAYVEKTEFGYSPKFWLDKWRRFKSG